MKKFRIVFIFFFLILSCSSKTDLLEFSKDPVGTEFEVIDTLKLKGFIIFNHKNLGQFYKVDNWIIKDTIDYLRKIKRNRPYHIFVQPFDAKKYKIYSNYCATSELESISFLKKIRHKNKMVYIFTKDEFILLQNNSGLSYLSFKCGKPHISVKKNLDN